MASAPDTSVSAERTEGPIKAMSRVPCNGCTACCRGQIIVLFPEMGDDPTKFKHHNSHGLLVVDEKPNGDCIYLDEKGCSIHGSAPAMCRKFDCRDMVKQIGSRRERRAALADGRLSREIHDSAMARMGTL